MFRCIALFLYISILEVEREKRKSQKVRKKLSSGKVVFIFIDLEKRGLGLAKKKLFNIYS
jgi:hypothetical protein